MARPRNQEPTHRLRKRRGVWVVSYTDTDTPGRPTRRFSTGVAAGPETEPPEAARRFLDEWLESLRDPGEDPTLSALLDARLEELEARGTGQNKRVRSLHDSIKTRMGHLRASAITRPRLSRYIKDRGHRVVTARELEEVKAALRLGWREGWTGPPPMFPPLPKMPPRDRFLTRTQGQKLLQAATYQHVRLFILVALLSGQRRGAILDLTWDRVDLDRGIIDFRNPSKAENKKKRAIVRLDGRTLAALQQARAYAVTDHVIEYGGKPVLDIKRGFAQAAVDAGLWEWAKANNGEAIKKPWATPHLLKHSVISWLCEKWDIDTVADFTFTDRKTVARIYRHVNPDRYAGLSSDLAETVLGAPVEVDPDGADDANGTGT